MKTLTIQIGNTDDKLSQARWAKYVAAMRQVIETHSREIHFFGASAGCEPWQNAAWVLVCSESKMAKLTSAMTKIRKKFGQKAVAVTVGETEFV